MKQVSGTLRLDLAQYRELAAFSQFGSDMDKATQDALNHGARMMEILKQNQYSPLAAEEQVAVMYAAVNGYLSDVEVKDVVAWGDGFVQYLRTSGTALLAEIREKKSLDDELIAHIVETIKAYKDSIK